MDPTKVFYDREYEGERYARPKKQEEHPFYPTLLHFVEKYGLRSKRCLEVGCGRGAFQDIVDDYMGVDISSTVGRYLHKPFVTSSATNLPFTEDSFDAIWSYAVLEHVPEPEQAPNYNKYWMSDSDALNSMDPFDAILWFISRNDESISYPSLFSAIKIRTGALLLRLIKLHKGRNTQYR